MTSLTGNSKDTLKGPTASFTWAAEAIEIIFKTVLQAIKSLVDKIKGKKQRGEALDKTEQGVLDAADKVEDAVKSEVKDNAEEKIGEAFLNPITLVLIAVGIFLLIRRGTNA